MLRLLVLLGCGLSVCAQRTQTIRTTSTSTSEENPDNLLTSGRQVFVLPGGVQTGGAGVQTISLADLQGFQGGGGVSLASLGGLQGGGGGFQIVRVGGESAGAGVQTITLADLQRLQGFQQGGGQQFQVVGLGGQQQQAGARFAVVGGGGQSQVRTEKVQTIIQDAPQTVAVARKTTTVQKTQDTKTYRPQEEEESLGEEHANPKPEPYSFQYSTDDGDGSSTSREETQDANGLVKGFYTIVDKDGRKRRVDYEADHNGYRATVQTNEVGTESKNPADVIMESSAPTAAELVARWEAEEGAGRRFESQRTRPVASPPAARLSTTVAVDSRSQEGVSGIQFAPPRTSNINIETVSARQEGAGLQEFNIQGLQGGGGIQTISLADLQGLQGGAGVGGQRFIIVPSGVAGTSAGSNTVVRYVTGGGLGGLQGIQAGGGQRFVIVPSNTVSGESTLVKRETPKVEAQAAPLFGARRTRAGTKS